MRFVQNLVKVLFLLSIVLVGCLPAPLPINDVDLVLKPGAEICMKVADLEAAKADSFKSGYTSGLEKCPNKCLRNPTYAELQKLLKDNQALTMCQENCVGYTMNLNDCAIKNGYSMAIVLLNFKEGNTGHVLGAFQTEKGLIFIEAQTLWIVKVELGYDYSNNFTEHNWTFPQSTIIQIGILK